MTAPAGHELVPVPAGQAGEISDLLIIAGTVLSALAERGRRGDTATLASLEQLARLLTGGGDAAALITRIEDAQEELAGLINRSQP